MKVYIDNYKKEKDSSNKINNLKKEKEKINIILFLRDIPNLIYFRTI
jgi:hypothetical protein